MSTVRDTATLNELRRLIQRLERLEAQISQFVKNNTVITNHDTLQHLDYASSGHTGFAATSSLPAGANPTATISDTAVNGSATTFMRSDGAPALGTTLLGKLVHSGTIAGGDPPNNEVLWVVTDGGPFGNGSLRMSVDSGSTYKETGIVFS